jgi:hypothetical protein
MKLMMENPHTGIIKTAPIGRGGLPFFRGDVKWSVIAIILVVCLNIIGLFIWEYMMNYNKTYITQLLEKGFKVRDVIGGTLDEAKAKLGINLPQFESKS